MELIACCLAQQLTGKLKQDEKHLHIYQYAIQVLIEKWTGLGAALAIACFIGMPKEFLLFILIFMPIRSYGGGFHMKTYAGCFFASNLLITAILLAAKYLPLYKYSYIWCPIALAALAGIQFMAPVLHINRPMRQEEMDRCRSCVRKITAAIAGLLLVLAMKNYSKQVFMITETVSVSFIMMIVGKQEFKRAQEKRMAEQQAEIK